MTTFIILTIGANLLMAEINGRMPVIIRSEDYTAWIDMNLTDASKIQAMAQPYYELFMEAYPIIRNANSPTNESTDLLEPI